MAGFGSSRLAILSALVVMSGCKKSPEACFPLVGRIDERMERVVEGLAPGSCAIITSPGGRYESAINIASMLNEKDIRLEIGPFCASACFDGIFLLTDQTHIQDGAILMVHHSPLLIGAAMESEGNEFEDLCISTPLLEASLDELQRRYGQHAGYTRVAMEAIDFGVMTSTNEARDCESLTYKQSVEGWIPTSRELIELGLIDKGTSLCADDQACLKSFEPSDTQKCHWSGQEIPCPDYASVLASRSAFSR